MLTKIKNILSNHLIWNLLVCLMSFTGVLTVLYSTVWGAVLSDDSYYYISSARNLLAGNGFDLTTHFPPILPLLLSGIGLFKLDPLITVRWLNAFLFGLNILTIAWIIRLLTNSLVGSLLGALMALIFSSLIVVHSGAMSEALYINLNLLGLLNFTIRNQKGYRGALWIAGLFFGLAAATRYIGVSLLLAGGVFGLTEAGKNRRARVHNTLWFGLVGILPLLFWFLRNQILTGHLTSRAFAWHPLTSSLWIKALNTILLWLVPGRFVNGKELFWLGGIIFILAIWLILIYYQNRRGLYSMGKALYQSSSVYLICLILLAYWFILIISRSFLDRFIPMDERLLSPILVMGLILTAWLFTQSWDRGNWWGHISIIAVCLILIITNLTRSVQLVQSYNQVGRGYASARDHISETYAYLRNHPTTPVYSNAFAAIYFWTGRVTHPIPSSNEIEQMKEDMHEKGAYLVVFYSIPVELYGVTEQELTGGLVEQIRLSEAVIYRSP
jgi:hypothetical protein